MWDERHNLPDDPLGHVMQVTLNARTHTSRYIKGLIDDDVDHVQVAMEKIKCDLAHTTSSRRIIYKVLNIDLFVHRMYIARENIVERYRIAFTRLRLSGHSLAVETGRGNRRGRGRLPLEERLCPCGDVQTELHAFESCPMTQQLRQSYNIVSLAQFLNGPNDYHITCEAVYKILSIFY